MTAPTPASGPGDPYAAMLRGAALPTLAVGVVATVVAGLQRGGPAVLAAVLATVVVSLSFSSTLLVMRRMARTNPASVMAAALATYMGKVLVLGVFLVLFGRASWLDGQVFGVVAIVCAAVWLLFEALSYSRLRVLVMDPDAAGRAERHP